MQETIKMSCHAILIFYSVYQLYAAAIKQNERPRPKVTCFRCGKQGKATLHESVPVQANAKIVPTCNATNAGGTDTSSVNVETSKGSLKEPQAGRQPRNK